MAEVYIKDLPVHPELKDDDYILIEGDTTDKIRYKDFADAVANKSDPVFLWRDGTWDDIAYWLRKHDNGDINIYDYIKVGDVKEVPISAIPAAYGSQSRSEQTVKMVIADKNVVDLASGEKCHFVVHCSVLVGGAMIHDREGSYGWKDFQVRKWANDTFKKSLPTKLQTLIKPASIKSLTQAGASGVTTTVDDVFLPAVVNNNGRITSGDSTALNGEDTIQWEFCKNGSNLNIIGNNGWSCRSVSPVQSNKFHGVNSNHSLITMTWTGEYNVAPCFCI